MAQREIQIDKIITQMNLNSWLNSIFWWRIYRWKPVSDNQSGIYCILNIITKPISEQAYCMVRVEVRIVWNNNQTKIKDLIEAKNAISLHFESTSSHNWFITYKIVEGGNFFNALDEKSRWVLVQDYLFYFATFL